MKLNLAVTWRHKSRHLPSLLLAIADKTLVVQFTVKHEQKIDCGGGYVKVRRERGRRRRVHVHEEERGRGREINSQLIASPRTVREGEKVFHYYYYYY